jgi:hypothetical protein
VSIENISAEKKSNIFYTVSNSIYGLSKDKIIPQISAILNLAELTTDKKTSEREKALIGIYFRVHGWMESVSKMNTSACFQGVAAAARAIFELVLDLEMLDNDPSGVNLKKFVGFPDMDRADVAEKCLRFFKENKQTLQMFREEHLLRAIQNKKDLVEKNRVSLWGKSKHGEVKHWTGEKNIKARAKSVKQEYENLYVEFYALLCWSIHSGATVYGGKDKETLEGYFQFSHGLFIKLSAIAIKVISKNFHLEKVIENLNIFLNHVKDEPYKIIVMETDKMASSTTK